MSFQQQQESSVQLWFLITLSFSASLSTKIHAGTAVAPSDLNWHVDDKNSILHLAVAIQGGVVLFRESGCDLGTGIPIALQGITGNVIEPKGLCHVYVFPYSHQNIPTGGRALHSKRSRVRDGEVEEVIEWQAPGDVYISSPSFFEHAVQYKQAYRSVCMRLRACVGGWVLCM